MAVELDFVPNAEELRRLAELREGLRDSPQFPQRTAREKSNAKLFTYLAATSDEPREIEAALEAIQWAYSPRSTRKETPDADVVRVLFRHLGSERAPIVARALSAARLPLMMDPPNTELCRIIAEMARSEVDPARRYAAIEALDSIRVQQRPDEVLSAFETALAAEAPEVVSVALLALEQSRPSFDEDPSRRSPTLGARTLELTRHAEPGVRGRALSLTVGLDWALDEAARFAQARRLLDDEHPYVRAVAADALGRLGKAEAFAALIRYVDDLAWARSEITGFVTLAGEPGQLRHDLPGRPRVASAVLHAIASLSSGELAVAVGPRQTEESLKESAHRARVWYEQKEAPRTPEPAPPDPHRE